MIKEFTTARQKIKTYMPDIILIDVALEYNIDWLILANFISAEQIPFIIITAHSENNMIEYISKTEPYGYFIKPFNPLNLHVTIQMSLYKFYKEKNAKESLDALKADNQNLKKLLFGKKITDKPIVYFGDGFSFNTNVCETFYKNKKIKLTKKENLFIQLLIVNIGLVVDFQQAIIYIWGKNRASENNVRTLVWRLRNKLQADTIKNASGTGYYIEDSKIILTLAS